MQAVTHTVTSQGCLFMHTASNLEILCHPLISPSLILNKCSALGLSLILLWIHPLASLVPKETRQPFYFYTHKYLKILRMVCFAECAPPFAAIPLANEFLSLLLYLLSGSYSPLSWASCEDYIRSHTITQWNMPGTHAHSTETARAQWHLALG